MPSDALEFLGWIIDGLGGWRYLMSSSFRRRTHERWRLEGWPAALLDILFSIFAMAFMLFVLGLLSIFIVGVIAG